MLRATSNVEEEAKAGNIDGNTLRLADAEAVPITTAGRIRQGIVVVVVHCWSCLSAGLRMERPHHSALAAADASEAQAIV